MVWAVLAAGKLYTEVGAERVGFEMKKIESRIVVCKTGVVDHSPLWERGPSLCRFRFY